MVSSVLLALVNTKPGRGNPGVKCLSRNIYASQA